jgi:pimeloyl-ACP methyl ester carboxylesterase
MWDPQWDVLQREHLVVRCDFRGFGRTPPPQGAFSNAADLVALLDELQLRAAVLVGSSMGGRVALEVALARPELVSALVVIGTIVPDDGWSDYVVRSWREEEEALERGDLDAAVEVNLRTWLDGPHRAAEQVDPELRRRVAAMQRRALELQTAGDEPEEAPLVEDAAGRLAEISVRTLSIVGQLDVADAPASAERLERELPDARRATIAGSAHFPSLEKPDEVNRLVLDFLREVKG